MKNPLFLFIEEHKWFQSKLVVISSLLFIAPLGWYLVWKYTDWTKPTKIATILISFTLFLLIVSSDSSEETTQQSEIAQQPEQNLIEGLNGEAKLRAIVESHLKGENNNDKKMLRDISLTGNADSGWVVDVSYNSNSNLTNNMTKRMIEGEMAEIYLDLFASKEVINLVGIEAYLPYTDTYGNAGDGVVYKTKLEKEEANKINWEADEFDLIHTIIPNVWSTLMLNSQFQE